MGFAAKPISIDKIDTSSFYSDNSTSFDVNMENVSVDSVNLEVENVNNKDVESVEYNVVDDIKEKKNETEEKVKDNIEKTYDDTAKKFKEPAESNDDEKKNNNISYEERHKFVNYYQYNYDNPYSEGTIATSGCGPTSAAMVLTYLTGKEITPVKTAEFGNGTYTCSEGTYWSYFEAVSNKYDVNCKEQSCTKENIVGSLNKGKPVIISMGPGHFTSGGHFIVLRGIDKNGKAIVADPNSEERSKQTWDMSTITSEGAQIWTFPDK